jgi:hypothetical protein
MECMTACGSLCPCITALGCLTLAKAAWRRLSLPFGAFFWPCTAFASLYRLYTDASSTIYLCGVLYRFWLQNTCTNVYYSSLAGWNCSDRYRAFLGSQHVEETASGERTTSIDPQAPGKNSDYRSPGELMESKTKLLDQMRHVLRLKHMSIRTEKAYVQWAKRFILFHHKRHPADMGASCSNSEPLCR